MVLSDKFYTFGTEYNTLANHIPSPYFRKNFELENQPEKITVTVCGLGFYDIYINGKKITKGILAPYIANIDDYCYYDTYDISEYVVSGKNTLGFLLGNGMKNPQGGTVWNFDTAKFVGAPEIAFAIEYNDGSKDVLIEADETVKTAPSPFTFDDLRFGVHYDATKEIENWNKPQFDDSSWKNVIKAPSPKGIKRICEADPITLRETLLPISVRKARLDNDYRSDKHYFPNREFTRDEYEGYLFDFGVNVAGCQVLEIEGTKGQKLEFQPCEYINHKNEPSYNNLLFYPDGYTQRDIYICKDGKQTFEPKFTYHGCRYIFIHGLTDEQAKNCSLKFKVYSSDIKKRADFTCSDETANTLFQMSDRSDISNYYYFPTDCPQREKNGWTGDITVSSEHLSLKYTCEKSQKEWMRNVCAAQNEKGTIPGIVPTTGWGYVWGNGPVFDNCLSHVPFCVCRFTDDEEILKENADAIFTYIEYSKNSCNEEGLLDYGLGDWVKPTSDLPTATVKCISSIVIYYMALESTKIFERIGQTDRAEISVAYAKELKKAIRGTFLDKENCTLDGGIMSSQALGVFFKVFEEDEMEKASKFLADSIVKNGYSHDCGFPGARGLFHALSDNGYTDIAYELLVGKNYTNYGLMIDQGLTALPEGFDCITEIGIPKSWRSLNHHFLGDYTNWLISKIAGIRVNPDFTSSLHIDISPDFPKKLTFAKAHFISKCGKVSSFWEKNGKTITLTVQKPNEVYGKIKLTNGWKFNDGTTEKPFESGTYTVTK